MKFSGNVQAYQEQAWREAITRLLDAVEPDYQVAVQLLYGSGLRLIE